MLRKLKKTKTFYRIICDIFQEISILLIVLYVGVKSK